MVAQSPQRDRRTRSVLRFSLYEISFVLVGCAMVTFRTGRIITFILWQPTQLHFPMELGQQHATQPQYLCMTSNDTTSALSTQTEPIKDGKTGIPSSSSRSPIPSHLFNGTSRSRCFLDFQYADFNLDVDRKHHEPRATTVLFEEQEVPSLMSLKYDALTSTRTQQSVTRRKKSYYYDAMVHPALLIHPQPYRAVILHDVGGHILPLVLQHSSIRQVICILPESSSRNNSQSSHLQIDRDEWSQRITWVYTNDPIAYFQQSLTPSSTNTTTTTATEMIDIVYVDYLT